MNDPYVIFYAVGGLIIVLLAFVVFALFTEGVKTLNKKLVEEEKKKKDIEKNKRAA